MLLVACVAVQDTSGSSCVSNADTSRNPDIYVAAFTDLLHEYGYSQDNTNIVFFLEISDQDPPPALLRRLRKLAYNISVRSDADFDYAVDEYNLSSTDTRMYWPRSSRCGLRGPVLSVSIGKRIDDNEIEIRLAIYGKYLNANGYNLVYRCVDGVWMAVGKRYNIWFSCNTLRNSEAEKGKVEVVCERLTRKRVPVL